MFWTIVSKKSQRLDQEIMDLQARQIDVQERMIASLQGQVSGYKQMLGSSAAALSNLVESPFTFLEQETLDSYRQLVNSYKESAKE